MPVSAGIVRSYVPGETTAAVVEATANEIADGLQVSLDFLGEDTTDVEQAEATVAAYVEVLKELSTRGLTRGLVAGTEVSVKLSAIGQALHESSRNECGRR